MALDITDPRIQNAMKVPLPSGWKAYYTSEFGGHVYYGNVETGESQWVAPGCFFIFTPGSSAQGSLSSSNAEHAEALRYSALLCGTPSPACREAVCEGRQRARDQWNTQDIRLQEIFHRYDRDGSGHLDQEDLWDLLHDMGNGREPSNKEQLFILTITDKDANGRISLEELAFAMRAWHCYCNLDSSILHLFTGFDADCSGLINESLLQALVIEINDGMPVPEAEVAHIIRRADMLGDGRISRSDLLGAIAAWYIHVDRKDTALIDLIQEAMARTAFDHDPRELLYSGSRHFAAATSIKNILDGSDLQDGSLVYLYSRYTQVSRLHPESRSHVQLPSGGADDCSRLHRCHRYLRNRSASMPEARATGLLEELAAASPKVTSEEEATGSGLLGEQAGAFLSLMEPQLPVTERRPDTGSSPFFASHCW
jgi:Ca2+-binding EF-hand superfamily protein